jgi:DNA repair protein RadC
LILSNAAAVILGHNHPSGDPQPSHEDRAITQRLKEAGALLGINVLDHLVIGADGRYFSFADENLL